MKLNALAMFLMTILMGFYISPAQAATAEEILAAINKLPANERQRRLEDGAKKERNLVVFYNQGVETIQE